MQKHGKALDDKVLFPENMGRHRKTCKKMGKYWMTKFHFGKTCENTGKTRENMQKHGKTFDDKVLFRINTGKHLELQENTRKHEKTREVIG